jgi:hypothetical protein
LVPLHARRQLWVLWAIFLALLALQLAIPQLVPSRQHPWHSGQRAVASFVLVLLSLTAGVASFARRERLREVRADAPDPSSAAGVARIRALLLGLWTSCLLIGIFGCLLAWGAGSPSAAWPFILAAAALLVFHAPRQWLFARPGR